MPGPRLNFYNAFLNNATVDVLLSSHSFLDPILDKLSFKDSKAYTIVETDDGASIELRIPGFDKEDVDIEIEDTESGFFVKTEVRNAERNDGSSHIFKFTSEYDSNKIKATVDKGLLNIVCGLKDDIPHKKKKVKIS